MQEESGAIDNRTSAQSHINTVARCTCICKYFASGKSVTKSKAQNIDS